MGKTIENFKSLYCTAKNLGIRAAIDDCIVETKENLGLYIMKSFEYTAIIPITALEISNFFKSKN